VAVTNGYAIITKSERGSWISGIIIVLVVVFGIGGLAWGLSWLRHNGHPIQCNPMTTNIIGLDLETVQKVCGEPWSYRYEGNETSQVITTLHYTGGEIILRGHGANNIGTHVIGWTLR
jgi:hypothetical protein